MATTEQKISPRGTAEMLVLGAVIGLVVWIATSDVVIGIIAGASLVVLMTVVARTWIGHGGSHLTHT